MADLLKEYEIAELLAKELTGALSPEEECVLREWQEQHPECYQTVLDAENLKAREEFVGSLRVDEAWEKVKRGAAVPSVRRLNAFRWMAVAASVVLCLGAGALWLWGGRAVQQVSPQLAAVIEVGSSKALLITPEGREIALQDSTVQQIELEGGITAVNDGKKVVYSDHSSSGNGGETVLKYNTIRVPKGGEYELLLSDRTKVMLNSETELRFPVSFGKDKRDVFLKGEAFFTVTKDTVRPFIVHVSDRISVKVLGTEFNVKAYPDEIRIEATLNRGAVSVSNKVDSVVLRPDQQAVYDKAEQKLSTREVVAERYSGWKDGKFSFENATLESIMVRLGRWYDIQVVYQNPEAKKYHFTGDLERYEHFDKALNMLEKATNVRFKIDRNNVIVSVDKKSH